MQRANQEIPQSPRGHHGSRKLYRFPPWQPSLTTPWTVLAEDAIVGPNYLFQHYSSCV